MCARTHTHIYIYNIQIKYADTPTYTYTRVCVKTTDRKQVKHITIVNCTMKQYDRIQSNVVQGLGVG